MTYELTSDASKCYQAAAALRAVLEAMACGCEQLSSAVTRADGTTITVEYTRRCLPCRMLPVLNDWAAELLQIIELRKIHADEKLDLACQLDELQSRMAAEAARHE